MPHEDAPTPDRRPHRQPRPTALALAEASESAGVEKINAVVDDTQTASTPAAPSRDTAEHGNRDGWVIQVASTDSKALARAFLEKTVKKAPQVLADASPFTSTFQKGGNTYYRARFSGFASKDKAWNACTALKRRRISCYAIAAE